MATRYAGKYRRSPYSQAIRIPVKNIWFFAIFITGEDVLASPQEIFFFSVGGRQFLLGGTCPLHSPLTSHTVPWRELRDLPQDV